VDEWSKKRDQEGLGFSTTSRTQRAGWEGTIDKAQRATQKVTKVLETGKRVKDTLEDWTEKREALQDRFRGTSTTSSGVEGSPSSLTTGRIEAPPLRSLDRTAGTSGDRLGWSPRLSLATPKDMWEEAREKQRQAHTPKSHYHSLSQRMLRNELGSLEDLAKRQEALRAQMLLRRKAAREEERKEEEKREKRRNRKKDRF
ncbi:MAG: hypothetical protein AAFQ98_10135, partial [Bacteroidota bacterium]